MTKLLSRDIRIELTNGNVYYRRIVASTVLSGTVERLTLDSVLGVSVTDLPFK